MKPIPLNDETAKLAGRLVWFEPAADMTQQARIAPMLTFALWQPSAPHET